MFERKYFYKSFHSITDYRISCVDTWTITITSLNEGDFSVGEKNEEI